MESISAHDLLKCVWSDGNWLFAAGKSFNSPGCCNHALMQAEEGSPFCWAWGGTPAALFHLPRGIRFPACSFCLSKLYYKLLVNRAADATSFFFFELLQSFSLPLTRSLSSKWIDCLQGWQLPGEVWESGEGSPHQIRRWIGGIC